MYVDHRSAVAMQDHRLAELRRLADRRRAMERSQVDPEPSPGWLERVSPRALAARLRPRHV